MQSRILDKDGRPFVMNGDFEGASQAPRMSNFMAPTTGPNASIGNSLNTLRSRSRQAIRNQALAKGGRETTTANMVGDGITPRFAFKDNTELKEEVQELWKDSVPEIDFDGTTDFYGQQAIVSDAMFSDGEVLAVIRPQSPYEDLAVPFQVQLLEADHLPVEETRTRRNGNKIRMGIEYNVSGKREAFWLYKDHPGEYFMDDHSSDLVRIPAKYVCHVYDVNRPGQQRGLPAMSATLVKLNEIDLCDDAELVRRKTTAMFGGFITQIQNYEQGKPLNPLGPFSTVGGQDVIALEPGTWPVLKPGQEVKFAEPKDVSGSYIAWMKRQLMTLSRGWGITYEQLSQDLDGVTYGSIRAGLLEFRRAISMKRQKTLVFQFCRPIMQAWLTTAVLTDRIESLSAAEYLEKKRRYWRAIHFQGQPWPWIDPLKDIMGEKLEMRIGRKSRSMSVSERGVDIESLDAEINEDNIRADKYDLVFDSDPRTTTDNGMIQSALQKEIENEF